MKKILMLGSSHSACFSQIDASFPELQLSIAANQSTGLFEKLQIDENGVISCDDKIKEWNNNVFKKSLGASSRCINDYDSIILNVRFICNLPNIFHFNVAQSQSIHAYSLELIKRVMENSLMKDSVGLEGNRNLIEKLNSFGYSGQIFLMINPFTTSKNQDLVYNENICASRKQFLLDFISLNLERQFGVKILLPNASMINSHLFVHSKYAAGTESTWKGRKESVIGKDLSHKNKQYALDILRANAEILGIETF